MFVIRPSLSGIGVHVRIKKNTIKAYATSFISNCTPPTSIFSFMVKTGVKHPQLFFRDLRENPHFYDFAPVDTAPHIQDNKTEP